VAVTATRPGRLAGWFVLVGVLTTVNYAARAAGGKPDRNVLYQYGAAVGSLVEFLLILAVALALAGPENRAELLALRRPRSIRRAVGVAILVIVGVYAVYAGLDPVLHPGREQGLTPTSWQPSHAGAYAANVAVIALVGPAVEELTFRGLGFGLLEPYGRTLAIVVTGVAFGLVHGLAEALPILVAFGIGLAYLRSVTDSVYPGMVVHALFNGVALALAVAF
jgi:membrane protease YdiL (CAAX protease family)